MSKNEKIGNAYFGISLFLVTLFVSTANAATCHHYSKWYYPYPQPRCGVYARAAEDHSWYVEITQLPSNWEREMALDKLREQLK